MNSSPPLLEVRHVSKAFPGVQALDKVSLSLQRGEVLAVIGENGAGKSTLMKILGGVYVADSGTILMNGEPVRLGSVNDALRLGISLIHQELNLAENLSVAANIFLGREKLLGGPLGLLRQAEMNTQARHLMDQVGLGCSPQTIVGRLSPGRRQLVEIARALSMYVRILIMDEPTSSLTQRETETLYGVIEDLQRKGVAIVYISHRLGEVERIAHRVVVLRDGRNAGELTRARVASQNAPLLAHQASIVEPDAQAKDTFKPDAQAKDTFKPDAQAKDIFKPEAQAKDFTAAISHEAMVRLMVGRELSQFFKRQHTAHFEKVRMELRDVRYEGAPGRLSGLSEPISFTIHAGEILGMAGLVGSGRTELAEAVFGLRRIVSGEVLLDRKPIKLRTPRKAIDEGLLLVPEDRRYHGLILQDNVLYNISLPNLDLLSMLRLVSAGKEKALAKSMCERLRVRTPSIRQTVGLLSGGNQQKIVLSKWLVRRPRVLIVDEPTRGIDVGSKSEIYALLDQLAGDGVAIWMISSDLEEILGMSDRVAVLHEGRLTGILHREQLSEEAIMHLATGGKAR